MSNQTSKDEIIQEAALKEARETWPAFNDPHQGHERSAFMAGVRFALARSAPETSGDAEDAAKWRALRNCARMTAMGSAGLGPEKAADDYAHVTLNFWTGGTYDSPGEVFARHWLDAFVEKARRALKTSEGPR